MGFMLLWLEALALAGCGVAAGLAAGLSLRATALRRVAIGLCALAPTLGGVALTVLAHQVAPHEPGGWPAFAGGWTLVCALTTLYLVRQGIRLIGDPPEPAARAWPAGRCALGAAGAGALLVLTIGSLDSGLRIQLAALRSEAGALALSVAPPRLPERANAAPLYERAFSALGEPADWPADFDAKLGAARAGEASGAEAERTAFLRRMGPALALLHRAAAVPDCAFERDYGRVSASTLLPELAALRRAARLLELDARDGLETGRRGDAWRDLRTLFAIARHLRGSGPVLISWLVALAIDGQGVDLTRTLLERAPEGATLEHLQAIDDVGSYQRALLRTLYLEEAFGLAAFGSIAQAGVPDPIECAEVAPLGNSLIGPLWRVFLLPADLAAYQRMMKQAQALSVQAYHVARPGWDQLSADARNRQGNLLTSVLVSALHSCAERGARADARRRLAVAATAAELHRARTGAYPAAIDRLVPELLEVVLVDPYDGKPLRLACGEEGITVYSVGPDGVDDGGAEFNEPAQTGDLMLRVRRTK